MKSAMNWVQADQFANGTPSEYRQPETGAKVWMMGRRWVSCPFGMMLRGEKGGIRLFASAEAAMRAAEREIDDLRSVRSPYFRVERAA